MEIIRRFTKQPTAIEWAELHRYGVKSLPERFGDELIHNPSTLRWVLRGLVTAGVISADVASDVLTALTFSPESTGGTIVLLGIYLLKVKKKADGSDEEKQLREHLKKAILDGLRHSAKASKLEEKRPRAWANDAAEYRARAADAFERAAVLTAPGDLDVANDLLTRAMDLVRTPSSNIPPEVGANLKQRGRELADAWQSASIQVNGSANGGRRALR
jgi:hypothetical protein